jgi:hypothetical protein
VFTPPSPISLLDTCNSAPIGGASLPFTIAISSHHVVTHERSIFIWDMKHSLRQQRTCVGAVFLLLCGQQGKSTLAHPLWLTGVDAPIIKRYILKYLKILKKYILIYI